MSVSRDILKKIKQLPPEKVLSYLRIPYKQVGNQIMAQATWRDEREASVSIQYKDGKWLWHDFGTGEGGDWIDLYQLATGSDFKEAISILMELSNLAYMPDTEKSNLVVVKKGKKCSLKVHKNQFEVVKSSLLKDLDDLPESLKNYLKRKNFLEYLDYLKVLPLYYLRYRRGDKEYSGLAVKTLTGQWVIKTVTESGEFKTYVSESPAGISMWQPLLGLKEDKMLVVVTESFTDAIALRLYRDFDSFHILILNGVGNVNKAVLFLRLLNPDTIYVATDLDKGGVEAERKIKEAFPESERILFYGKDAAAHIEKFGMNPTVVPIPISLVYNMPKEALIRIVESNILKDLLNDYPEIAKSIKSESGKL